MQLENQSGTEQDAKGAGGKGKEERSMGVAWPREVRKAACAEALPHPSICQLAVGPLSIRLPLAL